MSRGHCGAHVEAAAGVISTPSKAEATRALGFQLGLWRPSQERFQEVTGWTC